MGFMDQIRAWLSGGERETTTASPAAPEEASQVPPAEPENAEGPQGQTGPSEGPTPS